MLIARNTLLPAAIALAAFPLAAQTYSFEKLQLPKPMPNATFGQGINNRGEVAGYFGFRGSKQVEFRGFRRYSDGQFEAPIIDPNDTEFATYAQGINDSHVIVGYYMGSDLNFHGFVDTGGAFTTFDPQAGVSTQIYGINDLGQFVGAFGDFGTLATHGFVDTNGAVTQIDVPESTATQVWAIDRAGALAGCAQQFPGWENRAFLRDVGGTYVLFRPPQSALSFCATGVSGELGLIVGYYFEKSGSRVHGFIYNYRAAGASPDAATGEVPVTVLDYPGAELTYAYGINSKGQISGYAVTHREPPFGFIATPTAAPAPGN